MTAKEQQFGVASMVRCSFSKLKDGAWKTSGACHPFGFQESRHAEGYSHLRIAASGPVAAERKAGDSARQPTTAISRTRKHWRRSSCRLDVDKFGRVSRWWRIVASPTHRFTRGHFTAWTEGTAENSPSAARACVGRHAPIWMGPRVLKILILTSCTGEKAAYSPEQLTLEDFRQGALTS